MKKYVAIFFAYLCIAISVNFNNQFWLVPAAFVSMAFLNWRVFRIILKWKLLLFLGILVFCTPIFSSQKDAVFMGISYSRNVFEISVVMAYRSLIILMALKYFTQKISVQEIARSLSKLKLLGFGQVFELSLTTLPEVKKITVDCLDEYKISHPFSVFKDTFEWLVKLLVRILVYADTISLNKINQGE